ncbi:MAG TPA: hemolysin family protein [Rhodothermales bacterium]
MTVTVWLIIVLLIAVNALYVAAEFGAVGVRRSRVRQRAEEGDWMARLLLPVIDSPGSLDRYIAACQIGITLSSLVLGAYGQANLAVALVPVFASFGGMQEVAAESTAALVVLLGLTALQMVLGELVPKSIALQYPNRVSLILALPMRWSLAIFSWFIVALNGSGNLVLRLIGAPLGAHRHIHSPEEIDLLIAESRDGGLLEPDEQRRLHRALQLSIRPAHQLMVPRLYMSAISVDTPPEELLQHIRKNRYTRLPVYGESIDDIVGMLHTKDLLVYYLEHGRLPAIREVMRPMAMFAETITADRLISLMRKRRSQQAIVVDEFGGVAGLVTIENVLADVLGKVPGLEPSLGPVAEPLPDGRVRLPGMMRLHDAEPWIGVLWDGEADTVGGRIVEALGYMPAAHETLEIDGVVVEVEAVTDKLIVSVIATPRPPNEEQDES